MPATRKFDRTAAVRVLEAHGLDSNQAAGIAEVLEKHVLPCVEANHLGGIDESLAKVAHAVTASKRTPQERDSANHDFLLKLGAMLAAAVAFLTLVQVLFD